MPYHWMETDEKEILTLWPHQSLTGRGFALFIGATGIMLTVPLLAVLGSPVAWILMACFLAAIWGIWQAIMANRAHRSLHEELSLTPERIHLAHVQSRGDVLEWEANPHWVSVNLRRDGPVESYLTLRGGGREVEIGRFLTPEERQGLYEDLNYRLRAP